MYKFTKSAENAGANAKDAGRITIIACNPPSNGSFLFLFTSSFTLSPICTSS